METTGGDNMVNYALQRIEQAPAEREFQNQFISPFKWTSVSIQEVFKKECKLKPNMYGIEARKAKDDLKACKWDVINLCGEKGLAIAYRPPICKRIFVEKNEYSIPMYVPSQILDILPIPYKFLSRKTNANLDDWNLKKGQVLLSCSGTIGNVTYVSKTLENKCFSQNLIRISLENYGGYVYTFLKSRIGQTLLSINKYGSVIQHIDPEHLNNIPIPNPSPIIKQQIHEYIDDSFRLRDESNTLIKEARILLQDVLKLQDIDAQEQYYYSVSLNQLDNRLDGSYHIPIVTKILKTLRKTSKELLTIGDERISQSVILPGRFKRVYVEEGNGVVFFGGKQLYELDPSNKKYLSLKHHGERIKKELTLQENMTLITCSGTIGKVTIVPLHWEGWTANQHIIRVVPINDDIAGYIYAWLSSDYAYHLITRYTYGAVIDEVDAKQISKIPIPLLHDKNIQKEINDKVLEANQKRTEAYKLEQKALQILDEKVIYAKETDG